METLAKTTAAAAGWTGQADTLLVVHYGAKSTVSAIVQLQHRQGLERRTIRVRQLAQMEPQQTGTQA